MVRFLDGPAAGVVLMLRRAPPYLRVTVNAAGEWDALDQLGDEAARGEAVTVYRRVGKAGRLHIDYTRKQSAWYAVAEYRQAPEQPDDATGRDTAKWRAWATGRAKLEREGHA